MTLNNAEPHTLAEPPAGEDPYAFDFTFVPTTARIALYDDLLSAPRVIEVKPAETTQYIESLASTVYEQARQAGGSIPYTVIREVSENFIHARFREIIVSVLDAGNTIRFADQGPGIPYKDQAQKPGFSSAVEPMKKYIRGVGSGLPIVRDYLDMSHGNITIEDNLGRGSVVTISVTPHPSAPPAGAMAAGYQPQVAPAAAGGYPVGGTAGAMQPNSAYGAQPTMAGYGADPRQQAYPQAMAFDAYGNAIPAGAAGMPAAAYGAPSSYPVASVPAQAQPWGTPAAAAPARVQSLAPHLSEREQDVLRLLYQDGELGVTEISHILEAAPSSVHNALKKLEQAALVMSGQNKKRRLTDLGVAVAQTI